VCKAVVLERLVALDKGLVKLASQFRVGAQKSGCGG
jgi:hypothetical protein